MFKKNKKKISTKTNKQTNTIPKPQTNKNHYKPQNHPWHRLTDWIRNILFFIVFKSAFKYLKKIKNTVRKSDTVLRLPDFTSTSMPSQKVSTSTLCACCRSTHHILLPFPKLSAIIFATSNKTQKSLLTVFTKQTKSLCQKAHFKIKRCMRKIV